MQELTNGELIAHYSALAAVQAMELEELEKKMQGLEELETKTKELEEENKRLREELDQLKNG